MTRSFQVAFLTMLAVASGWSLASQSRAVDVSSALGAFSFSQVDFSYFGPGGVTEIDSTWGNVQIVDPLVLSRISSVRFSACDITKIPEPWS